jgi:SHS2 domain-containing protein
VPDSVAIRPTGIFRPEANLILLILFDDSERYPIFRNICRQLSGVKMLKEESINRSELLHEAAFEEIEHTADRALRIYGSDLRELLVNAAHGMNSLMVRKPAATSTPVARSIELDAMDAESMLVEWLSELAFWAETEMLVFDRFDLHDVSPTHLKATIYGNRAQQLEKHVKAVTYHNLAIVRTARGVSATVVFDV